ncbi:Nucleotide-binding universal stress protein, UspA family [Maribacter sedimenticola]|uniref:Nucleotide-binding universal stress protein, UspA family n=1 Tax=Maribacter sedimenticola TaxID=228956 RepID=A0ABY1SFE4_9FLAO|nr:universal stress protein [Maribacter sedimenticola]SNR40618.1 Nucleotide-binding universal stress protein, UspA family [Maribacter sedimenticola]
MNKRILIPTDFSKNALNAVRYAIDLYAKLHCDFYFLNVFSVESYTNTNLLMPDEDSEVFIRAKEKSEKNFLKLLESLAAHGDNFKHNFFTISTCSFLSEAIKKIIAEKDIELVVMGTHGASGSRGSLMGSNTVMAMEKIRECPVMAIPSEYSFSPPTEIVFPTDYKDAFKRTELRYLMEIAKMHEANIAVLHLNMSKELSQMQEDNKKLLHAILGEVAHDFHVLPERNLAKGIQSFVEERNSDIIAFINHKHFFFSSVFTKPLVKAIGYDSTIPILALH